MEESDSDDEIKPIKEKKVKVDDKFKTISTYNGGKNDRYSWSQDITCVTVELPLK